VSSSFQSRLKSLIDILSIKKIIFVDDNFGSDVDVLDSVKASCQNIMDSGKTAKLQELFSEINFEDPEAVWKENISDFWASLSENKETEILAELTKLCDDTDIIEPFYLKQIQDWLSDFDFEGLTPEQWTTNKDTILQNINDDNKLLLLVDKELHQRTNGVQLVKSVLKDQNTGNVFYGMLTHTIHNIDEEWNSWESDFKKEMSQIYPLSKKRLLDQELMLKGLKIVLLNFQCNSLKTKIKDIAKKTNTEAIKKLDKINVIHFDQMVFQSSAKEGILETDTLLRIYYLLHKNHIRSKLNQDEDVIKLAKMIRQMGQIQTNETDLPNFNKIFELQESEIYEQGDYLNKHNTPIDLGDIFRIDNSDYILVAQSCDLVIRTSKPRSINKAFLIRIEKNKTSKKSLLNHLDKRYEKIKDGILSKEDFLSGVNQRLNEVLNEKKYYELPYYTEDKNIYCADFSNAHVINLDILDFCVFNESGLGEINKNQVEPSHLTLGWSSRFHKIIEFVNSITEENLSDFSNDLVKLNIDDNKIISNIKRIKRLNQPYSHDLLIKFSQHISRLGLNHDLSRR
jgi:hypothetical protein